MPRPALLQTTAEVMLKNTLTLFSGACGDESLKPASMQAFTGFLLVQDTFTLHGSSDPISILLSSHDEAQIGYDPQTCKQEKKHMRSDIPQCGNKSSVSHT